MRTIHVERVLDAPIGRIFDVLADHAGYARFPGIKRAVLSRPGVSEPNGVGALREIAAGAAWFEEEIVGFERPRLLEYKILRSRPPIVHDIGRITLVQEDAGVRVTWTSVMRIALPVVGNLVGAVAAWQLSRSFAAALARVEQLARQPVAA